MSPKNEDGSGPMVGQHVSRLGDRRLASPDEPVLVTGANGFIGTRVVKTLLEHGFQRVRCLVRSPSGAVHLRAAIGDVDSAADRVQMVVGNLLRPTDCRTAVGKAAVVFHLAAGVEKSFAGCFMNSVLTTRNLLDAAIDAGTVRRFVNVSSFAVYAPGGLRRGAVVDETTATEQCPQERFDPYGYAKLKQDELVVEYHRRFGLPYVLVRPGVVFGPGKASLSGRIGIDTFGLFLHMGGANRPPLTFVDNCADAIVLAGLVGGVDGEIFNVVDDEGPTSRRLLYLYKRRVGWFPSVPVPYVVSYLLSSAWEAYSKWSSGQLPPRFNRRRAAAEWRPQRYSNEKVKRMLGWSPRLGIDQAVSTFLDSLQRHP